MEAKQGKKVCIDEGNIGEVSVDGDDNGKGERGREGDIMGM